MKIFISWSGELSHSVALVLREWIPVVLPFAQAWVSSEDIAKGSRWGAELAAELDTTNCGIICLTPDNIQEPWLNFEAGALSKTVDRAQVHPFLLSLPRKDLVGPLSQFQATEFAPNDIQKLVGAINEQAGVASLPKEQLDRNFQTCWPDLNQRLSPLLAQSSDKQVKAHVASAAPGSASNNELTDEDVKALTIMVQASGERVFPPQLASPLSIHPERAKHIMEKLEALGFLLASHNYIHGTSWLLSRKGRAELVRRNLL